MDKQTKRCSESDSFLMLLEYRADAMRVVRDSNVLQQEMPPFLYMDNYQTGIGLINQFVTRTQYLRMIESQDALPDKVLCNLLVKKGRFV